MKEIKGIIRKRKGTDTTTKAALATVVHVAGSSYRREGARMLITDDGHWTGGISGGWPDNATTHITGIGAQDQKVSQFSWNGVSSNELQALVNMFLKRVQKLFPETHHIIMIIFA